MKASEFDKRFDDGKDISKYLDVSKARRPEQEQKRVNVDFLLWMIHYIRQRSKTFGCASTIHHQSLARRTSRKSLALMDFLVRCQPSRQRESMRKKELNMDNNSIRKHNPGLLSDKR